MDNYADYAKFTVPGICQIKNSYKDYNPKILPTGMAFTEGKKVNIEVGYDGKNKKVFEGFIKRINYKIPVEVECEGYSYQLLGIMPTKTFTNTTLKKVLEELVVGTGIVLSEQIPHVPITQVRFENCTGVQWLEWFREKMLQTVYFNFNELYVGLRYATRSITEVKHVLNWNVIKDEELLFNTNKEGAIVNVHLTALKKSGGKDKVEGNSTSVSGKVAGKTNVKEIKVAGVNPNSDYAKALRDDMQKRQNLKGYSGSIKTFLEPLVQCNMTTEIVDNKYKDRTGKYVIEGVEGSFDRSGGRQKVQIGFKV
jgi:hypothetical protein